MEFFQADLTAQTLRREDLPSLVDTVCAEFVQRFLDDAQVQGGYEMLAPADREEYAELVVGRVRSTLYAALGLV